MRIQCEFLVMNDARNEYFILGGEYLSVYGIDIVHSKDKYFTIENENKRKKFLLHSAESGSIESMETKTPESFHNASQDCNISPRLKSSEQADLRKLLGKYQKAFEHGHNPLGTI